VKQKKPESNVRALFPPPEIGKWQVVEGEVHTSVTLTFAKAKKRFTAVFQCFVPFRNKGSFRNRIEITGISTAAELSEKELADLRREAKDALADFYAKYKKEKKNP
jgi:hypothetical protein